MNDVERVATKNIINRLDETRPLFAKIINKLDAAERGSQNLSDEDNYEIEAIRKDAATLYMRIAQYACILLSQNLDLINGGKEPDDG